MVRGDYFMANQLQTPEDLSPYLRQDVLATAEVQYDQT